MSDGNVTNTSAGKVWTLRISIPNALNIGLVFQQFNLSAAAQMYIFNEARTVVKGKIMKSYFVSTTSVATSPMTGNSVIVYIVEPGNSGAIQSAISMQKIMAGYQSVDEVGTFGSGGGGSFALNGGVVTNGATINCDPLIMCTPAYMSTARAVARFFTGNGAQCTGTLINNEANNGRAFFLTAFHCLDINRGLFGGHPGNNILDASEIAALANSVVQFQFWRTDCNGTVNNIGIEFQGTTVRTSLVNSDMVLLELVNAPGIGDGVNYAGWNRSTAEPSDGSSFVIHHPQAEDMRLTRTKDVRSFYYNNRYWTAHYSSGTVTHGSSGSALFNENRQITGQLRSGWSSCNLTDFGDRYGKLDYSWNLGGMQQWLSPNQNFLSMFSLDLFPLTVQGPTTLSCGNNGGNVQFRVPGNLLGCTYHWNIGSSLQIISGQGTGTLTVKGTQTSNTNSFVQVIITDNKGINRSATATLNLTLLTGAPAVNVTSTQGSCYGSARTWFLDATPNSGNSNWNWYIDHLGNNASIYIYSPNSSSTRLDVTGGGVVNLHYTDVCGVARTAGGPTVYSNCPPSFAVTPNPAQDNITVSSDNQSTNQFKKASGLIYAIKITDRLGTVRKTYEYKTGITSTKIQVANLNAGVYLVSVFDGHQWSSHPLIIKR